MVLVVALIFATSLTAQAHDGESSSGLDAKVVARDPGAVLSVQAQQPAEALTHAGQRYLITYRSRSPTVPTLFIQGDADQLVDPRGTHADYKKLCKAGKTISYRSIAKGSHRDALRESPRFTREFLAHLNEPGKLKSCAMDVSPPGHG